MTLRLVSDAPDTTRRIGAALAAALRPGDVVVLAGELGAGKTCLVQGLAAALGHDGRVTSPTFLLARRLDAASPAAATDAADVPRTITVLGHGDWVDRLADLAEALRTAAEPA